jgi:membrane fusion protein, multidrug efflux system
MKRLLLSFVIGIVAVSATGQEYNAKLQWSKQAVLSTPMSGVVKLLTTKVGDRVAQGQLLLQLDQRRFENALRNAKKQVYRYQLHLDEAKRERERTRELYERTLISAHDFQLEEIELANAQSDLAKAHASLVSSELDLEQSSIRAPFSGFILDIAVTPGVTVNNQQQATPMITLVQERPMHALALVSNEQLEAISADLPASVQVDVHHFDGKVAYVKPEPNHDGFYPLYVEFDPGSLTLRAGRPARVRMVK